MEKIYMLRATAQSGKNTVAELMKKYYEEEYNKSVIIIAEADYVKYTLSTYYGINDFKSKEGRSKIQKFATDEARGVDPYVWTHVVTGFLNAVQKDFDIAIIPDWRFYNEYEDMEKVFPGKVKTISITRPGVDKVDNMTTEQRQHKSETELAEFDNYNYNIVNYNGDFIGTLSQVTKIIDYEEE